MYFIKQHFFFDNNTHLITDASYIRFQNNQVIPHRICCNICLFVNFLSIKGSLQSLKKLKKTKRADKYRYGQVKSSQLLSCVVENFYITYIKLMLFYPQLDNKEITLSCLFGIKMADKNFTSIILF